METFSIYKFLPCANPIRPSTGQLEPDESNLKLVLKQPIKVSINHKRFQPQLGIKIQEFRRGKQMKIQDQNIDWQFQSGNLQNSLKIDLDTFRLTLRADTNSNHQSLWFYFKVKGMKKATFIVSPFRKPSSLYNQGMKICTRIQGGQWSRSGTQISYQPEGDHFILNFSLQFPDTDKWTEVSHCFPYTYTELEKYIEKKEKQTKINKQIIALSMMKRNIFQLVFKEQELKPIILITGRVHPGETVSSHILKGFLDNITIKSERTSILLQNYEIRVIPMLNPDGVAMGNYRCSYSGHDLNRRWKETSPSHHPQIYKVKKMIESISNRICMVIDVHGHSRKKGVFFYGCSTLSDLSSTSKQFPYLMEKCYPETFSFKNSSFQVQTSKQGTLRVHLWKKLKIPLVYTMECSFSGLESKNNLLPFQFQKIGLQLLEGLIVYYSPTFSKKIQILTQKRRLIIKKFQQQKDVLLNEDDSSGSDSQPQMGKLDNYSQFRQKNKSVKQTVKKSSFQIFRKSTGKKQDMRRFQSVVGQYRDQKIQLSSFKLKTMIKAEYNPEQCLRKDISSDRKLSSKIESQYRLSLQKYKNSSSNFKSTVLAGVRSQNEKNICSQRFTQMVSKAPRSCSQYQKTQYTNGSTQIIFPNNVIRQTVRLPSGKQFFGAQYVRVKKQAEKINKKKYISGPSPNQGICETNKQFREMCLQIKPLSSNKNIIKMQVYSCKN